MKKRIVLGLTMVLMGGVGTSVRADFDDPMEEQEPPPPKHVVTVSPPITGHSEVQREFISPHVLAQADAEHLEVEVTNDGRLRGAYDCEDCVQEVQIQRWDSATDEDEKTELGEEASRSHTAAGHTIELSNALPGAGQPVGLTVRARIVDPQLGVTRDAKRTLFGQMDATGHFVETDWQQWACDSGQARLRVGPDGEEELELFEPIEVVEE